MKNTCTICLEGRIDSNNAAETEKSLLAKANENPGAEIVLDAEKLDYISSAGLRVLMKLRKLAGKSIPIVNVSQEVYSILEVTGFIELFDVNKALREISVEGCEFIGSGGYGRVYRLDPETIVKLYNPGLSLEFVEREREISQRAFLMGVPTAISYDVVKCGESYGVVYEMLNAKTIAQVINENPGKVSELCRGSAKLLKKLHAITPGADSGLPDRKKDLLQWAESITGITEAESEKLIAFIRNIPERNTFLHGDYNSKNIMVRDGEFQLIDIGDAAIGHPVFDVVGLMLAYIILPQSQGGKYTDEMRRGLLGFDFDLAPKVWRVMCGTYFGLSSDDDVRVQTQKLMPYCMLMMSNHGFRLHHDEPEIVGGVLKILRERVIPSFEGAALLDF
ncbi:MAG: anti-sigma factor antagonist [Synergistaceae bacterium]|nr:anti-sigma factor antagonist [Synergistaceae bacterium]